MDATRRPKYQSVSEQLEVFLRTNPKVPSARAVASEYGVSLVTASRALQVLKDNGLIRTVEREGSFLAKDLNKTEAASGRWGVYLRSTPGHWRRASVASLVEGFQAISNGDGSVLEIQGLESSRGDVLDLEWIRGETRRWIDSEMEGLFFMPSRFSPVSTAWDEAFLGVCKTEGLPVVLIERNLRGVNRSLGHDLLASDDFDGGFQCASHLIEQGCRRLVFIAGSPTSTHEARMAGVFSAVRDPFSEGPSLSEPSVLIQKEGLPTKDAFEDLASLVLDLKADGVICYQDYTAVGLIVELLRRRARVPDDIAITGFDNLPIGNSFALGVTSYASSGVAMAAEAFRLMRSRIDEPGRPCVKVLVPGSLIRRESSLRQV